MSELKLCSYCKSVPQANTWTLHGITETRYFCPNPDCPHSVRTVTLEQWNTRPIEDDLRKRIADLEARAEKAEAMVEKLIEAGRMMKQPETIEEFHRGRRDYDALVAEWKESEE